MRLRSESPAVDSHDVGALRIVSIRTRVLRVVLVASAVVLLAFAIWSVRGSDVGTPALLPEAGGVVVIDLSLSIGDDDYNDIRGTLRRLIDEDASVGLVIFSDVGYELLPPGTPVSELRPLLRFLVPPKLGPPVNPWAGSFRAGTRISAALELARDMLFRDEVRNGSILLLSDLLTAPEDLPQLIRTLQELRGQSIGVQVVPLSPLRDGRVVFEGVFGKDALLAPSEIGGSRPVQAESGVALPAGLMLFGALLLVMLAAHEHFAGRLGLPRTQKRHA